MTFVTSTVKYTTCAESSIMSPKRRVTLIIDSPTSACSAILYATALRIDLNLFSNFDLATIANQGQPPQTLAQLTFG